MVRVDGALIAMNNTSLTTYTNTSQCISKSVFFTPLAGHDYEVLAEIRNNQCQLLVKELVNKNSGIEYQDVPSETIR